MNSEHFHLLYEQEPGTQEGQQREGTASSSGCMSAMLCHHCALASRDIPLGEHRCSAGDAPLLSCKLSSCALQRLLLLRRQVHWKTMHHCIRHERGPKGLLIYFTWVTISAYCNYKGNCLDVSIWSVTLNGTHIKPLIFSEGWKEKKMVFLNNHQAHMNTLQI